MAIASPAFWLPLLLASSQSVPLPGSVRIRIDASDLPLPLVVLSLAWVSVSV